MELARKQLESWDFSHSNFYYVAMRFDLVKLETIEVELNKILFIQSVGKYLKCREY